jgi:hypothetical protein
MCCRPVTADGRRWRFCPDEPPGLLQRVQAMVDLEVVDELTLAPPPVTPSITTSRAGLTPRRGRDGRLGLVGRPAGSLPPAAVVGTIVPVELAAAGYLRHTLEVTLQAPPQPTLTVGLHREPVALWGRVLDSAGPVAAASVTVVDFSPRGVDPVTAQPEDLLALAQGLYARRAASGPQAAVARPAPLVPAPEAYTLLRAAAAGATRLRLSDRQGLTLPPNPASLDIVAIEPGDPERLECLRGIAIEGASTADQPATVTLAHPLRRSHAEGAPVRRMQAPAPGADVALGREAIDGDVTLMVADATGFTPTIDFVEIATPGGVPAPEHQLLRPLAVVTDADGRFRLPALHRLASLTLEITAGATTVQQTVELASAGPVQLVELHLP